MTWRIIDPDGDVWNCFFKSEVAAWGQLCRFDDQRYETYEDRKARYVERGYQVVQFDDHGNVIEQTSDKVSNEPTN